MNDERQTEEEKLIRVRVGGMEYRVVDVPGLSADGELIYGQLDHVQGVIQLRLDLGPQARWVTLWHEVLHAILVHAGFYEHEERMISALAYGVTQVLGDNGWMDEGEG